MGHQSSWRLDGEMNLDLKTLFLVTIHVEAILGLLLLFAWVQNLQIRAVAWWGFSHLTRAASIVLFGMFGSVPQAISIDLANALLFLSFAMIWTGARLFDGRKPLLSGIVAGPLLWLIVSHLPAVGSQFELRFVVASGIITTYTWLAAYEFWCGRSERLVSRWPAIFVLFADGVLFLLRAPLAAMLPWSLIGHEFESVWLTVFSFEALMFSISIAFMLLAMAKERIEFLQRTAAMIDPLTGIANRRSFLKDAAELVRRTSAGRNRLAVLLMDLDHFKSINDRFGHAVGDRVLQIFAESTRETIRAADLFGRLGGEEFAVVLRNVKREDAIALAERIHRHFVEAAACVEGHPVGATVSIGVVLNEETALNMPELLAQADQALYCAKEHGRNRVEVATLDLVHKPREPVSQPPLLPAKSAA